MPAQTAAETTLSLTTGAFSLARSVAWWAFSWTRGSSLTRVATLDLFVALASGTGAEDVAGGADGEEEELLMVVSLRGLGGCQWVRRMRQTTQHDGHGEERTRGGEHLGARAATVGGGAVLQGVRPSRGLGLHVELGGELVDGVGELLALEGDVGLDLLGGPGVSHGGLP